MFICVCVRCLLIRHKRLGKQAKRPCVEASEKKTGATECGGGGGEECADLRQQNPPELAQMR